ncbi:MAG: ABC transporter permease [Polyangiaceae bacterium]
MYMRPGLLALFSLAFLGLIAVAYRAWVRGKIREQLIINVSFFSLILTFGTLLSLAGGVFAAVALERVAALSAASGWLGFGLMTVLEVLTFNIARATRGGFSIKLPGFCRAIPWVVAFSLGVAFIGLTYWSFSLPTARGSRYIWQDEAIRFGGLACGVIYLLCVLSALLPLILDLLERRNNVSFVAARHVRATKSGFLTVISVLSICGVAVSSCALCSVVSIMGGFGQDLKRKILGNNAHIVMNIPAQHQGFEDWQPLLERVKRVPGVMAVTPVVAGEAMVSSNASTAGVLVRGIDPDTIGDVVDVVKNIEYGKLDYLIDEQKLLSLPPNEVIGGGSDGEIYRKGPDLASVYNAGVDPTIRQFLRPPPALPGIIIGRELAKSLHLLVGDEMTMVSPLGDLGPMGVLPRARKFRVAAIFYSGMYEFDASHVYLRLDVAQKLFSLEGKLTTIEVKAFDAEGTEALIKPLQAQIDRNHTPDMVVRDWREMNKNLFSALKLERFATFIILSIAIAVASFCIICTLLLMVTEKGKEIAILKALGSTDQAIRGIFMTEGVIIGAIGTTFGVASGVATCLGLAWYGVRLDPDVYYIDRLPVATNPTDYVIVAICSMLICTLSTIYPATAASRLRPVDGLRQG